MKVINSEQIICIDVDDTLVMHAKAKKRDNLVHITDPYDGFQRCLVMHVPHIKILKDRKARGATILVWSQSGHAWAEAVICALGLQDYVDYVLSKPTAYIDDKKVQDWMAERIYLEPDSLYGRL